MSWKCDYCDTYNDEADLKCCVCDQLRSADSIREGKARMREERVARFDSVLVNKVSRWLKVLFVLGITFSLLAVVVDFIISKDDSNIEERIVEQVESIGDYIGKTKGASLSRRFTILKSCFTAHLRDKQTELTDICSELVERCSQRVEELMSLMICISSTVVSRLPNLCEPTSSVGI